VTTRFTLTINTPANDGATRAAERAQIQDVHLRVIQAVGDGTSTSNASLTDRSGNVVGEWVYSPSASS
jgi:hypothetical protein